MKFVQTGENLMDMTVIVKQEEFGTVMENAESKKIPVKIRSNCLTQTRKLKRLKTTSKGHFATRATFSPLKCVISL